MTYTRRRRPRRRRRHVPSLVYTAATLLSITFAIAYTCWLAMSASAAPKDSASLISTPMTETKYTPVRTEIGLPAKPPITPEPKQELMETYGLDLSNELWPITEPSGQVFSYTEQDLALFARLMMAEMGSDWIPDQVLLSVGSVVLNRINSDDFPDTLYDVIYQTDPVQYQPTVSGSINNTPTQRVKDAAKFLLEYGSILPADVVFQSESIQGPVYFQYYDSILGSTTYFCTP